MHASEKYMKVSEPVSEKFITKKSLEISLEENLVTEKVWELISGKVSEPVSLRFLGPNTDEIQI